MKMLLELKAVAAIFGVTRNTILIWAEAGVFPQPLRLSRRTLRWRASDIEKHIELLAAESQARKDQTALVSAID